MSKTIVKISDATRIAVRPAAKQVAAKPKKAIFNAMDVAGRLDALRQEAIEECHRQMVEDARTAAQQAGQEFDEGSVEITEDDVVRTRWWSSALKFEWSAARKGGNGTQWVSTEYRDAAGVAGPLVIRVNGERHCGQIMPLTDEGVAELAAQVKNPNVTIKKRDRKPAVQIQKWSAQVKTLDDGITVATDEEGQPILPSDDKLSAYYQVAFLVNEAFVSETKERLRRGADFITAVRGEKMAAKANAKAQAVLESFVKLNGARFAGDIILSNADVAEIRKMFPQKPEQDLLLRGAIQAPKTDIAKLVQETIGNSSAKNAGMPLPNPMTRIAMNFDKATGLAQLAFYDKSKPFEIDVVNAAGQKTKKQQYDIGKVDDDPINAENVHRFILSRSVLDGIVNMDSVCFSSLGISMPVKADVLVVEQSKGREITLDDVYGDGDGGGYGAGDALPDGGAGSAEGAGAESAPEPEAVASPAPAPSQGTKPPKTVPAPPKATSVPPKAPVVGKKPAPPAEENYEELLQGLESQ